MYNHELKVKKKNDLQVYIKDKVVDCIATFNRFILFLFVVTFQEFFLVINTVTYLHCSYMYCIFCAYGEDKSGCACCQIVFGFELK